MKFRNTINAWDVSEDHFPSYGSTREKYKFFVRYAILAPSGHNTQPWMFHIEEDELKLYADRTRGLPVIDPDDRELVISCGAALTLLEIAMKNFGFEPKISLLPDISDNDYLASIRVLSRDYSPTDFDKSLFKAIKKRRTNRMPFAEQKVDGQMLQKLISTVTEDPDVKFQIIEDMTIRENMMKLIEQGDKIQASDKSFCRELAQWVHPNRSSSRDGIPGYAFGMGDLISYGSPFFIGNLNWGDIQAGRDRNLVKGSPVLAVLETKGNKATDWLHCGMSLSKLLLRASAEGIAASYLNQPIEVQSLYEQLRQILNTKEYPQLIMRMGYGKEVKPTPRREVEDVVKFV